MLNIVQTTDEALLDACAEIMAHGEPFTTLNITYDRCRMAVRGEGKEAYLAYSDGEMAGFVVLQMAGSFRGYIQTICLKPEFRSKGLGTAMLKFCEERIHKVSPNVFMCVSSFNYKAQKLYYSLGFEKVGEFKDHFVRGYDEYLLRKSLGPIMEFVVKQ